VLYADGVVISVILGGNTQVN